MTSPRSSDDNADVSPVSEAAARTDAAAPGGGSDTGAEPTPPQAVRVDMEASAADARIDGAPSAAPEAKAPGQARSEVQAPSLSLIPFIAPRRFKAPRPTVGKLWRAAFERRFQLGAAAGALALALVGVVAASSIAYGSRQAHFLAAQIDGTQNLEETLKALKARINALETARRDEAADLHKTAIELKSGLGAARDVNSALAQLSARFERLERDQEARVEKLGERIDHDAAAHNAEFTAKLEKLGERLDHDSAAHNSDFASRLEKLEKKLAAPLVASLAPQAAPAAAPPKQPIPAPTFAAGVSKDTTGSITPPRAPIHGWTVRVVHDGLAIVAGPFGYRQIAPGDTLPGAGRVERFERNGSGWTVVTDQGVINSAYSASAYGAGPYGAFNGGYGPREGEF